MSSLEEKKREIARKMNGGGLENYGKLVLQSNTIQFLIFFLIMLNSASPDKEYKENLERQTLGSLINFLQSCTHLRMDMLKLLKDYNSHRNHLMHKMYSGNRLTPKTCIEELENGKKLIDFLKTLLKSRMSPVQFSELENMIAVLG